MQRHDQKTKHATTNATKEELKRNQKNALPSWASFPEGGRGPLTVSVSAARLVLVPLLCSWLLLSFCWIWLVCGPSSVYLLSQRVTFLLFVGVCFLSLHAFIRFRLGRSSNT
jgi:hypothetical protein